MKRKLVFLSALEATKEAVDSINSYFDKGYEIDQVIINGMEYIINNNTLKIENIQTDTTITITAIEINADIEIDLDFIIAASIIITGSLSLIGLGFAIVKRNRPY